MSISNVRLYARPGCHLCEVVEELLEELLGELQLADGHKAEAAASFERVLIVYPNRRLALEGLKAAKAAP